MFGSIAVVRPKAGKEADVVAMFDEWWRLRSPRPVREAMAVHVFRRIEHPGELMIPVVFETRESYEENARDPAQSHWHRRLAAMLEEEPRWMDGDVLTSHVRA